MGEATQEQASETVGDKSKRLVVSVLFAGHGALGHLLRVSRDADEMRSIHPSCNTDLGV